MSQDSMRPVRGRSSVDRTVLRERIMATRRELAATYPPRFRCSYCRALHGGRYDEGRNPDCVHRGDHFRELDEEARSLRREGLLNAR
jgi:hypothetical protein